MSFFKKNTTPRAVLIGVVLSIASILVITCLISVGMLVSPSIPYDYIAYIMLAADAVGIMIGSYAAAAISGSRGMIIGLLCAFCTFLILLIAGFAVRDGNIGIMTLLRAAVLFLFGILGGIKGVNRREKIRIK
jgi:putative membrane protein (TIGR04086 family)